MSLGTKTGCAPQRRTISGKETQYGTNIATASPSSKRAWQTLKTACLAPAVTRTFSRAQGVACSRRYFTAMASRRPGSPAESVYFVRPASIAVRSEEHTSELQSHHDLVCRLLLEKKK